MNEINFGKEEVSGGCFGGREGLRVRGATPVPESERGRVRSGPPKIIYKKIRTLVRIFFLHTNPV